MCKNGFTLIEVIIVGALTALITTILLVNFSRSRVGLDQTVNLVLAEIREAQASATSGRKFKAAGDLQSKLRCGYGIVSSSPRQFFVYTSPDAATSNCAAQNRNYEAATDIVVKTVELFDKKMEFKTSGTCAGLGGYFKHVFFEPPDPKTYVCNSALATSAPASLLLGPVGVDCASDPTSCKSVCVYVSGRIEVATGTVCP